MTTKKVCVIGHFGFGKNLLNGQTVKTKILTAELQKQFGDSDVIKKDTTGGAVALFRLPFILFKSLTQSENVVVLPAQNGVKIIIPMLVLLNAVFKRKLHYAVIGGWLADLVKNKRLLKLFLKRLNGIYVETSTMKNALEEMGFENVVVVPNCKNIEILLQEDLVYPKAEPYKLCTFSRVMKEKGIEDAVEAVRVINEKHNKTVYTLDIYGQVDEGQTEWFSNFQKTFPEYVKYGGLVPYDKSVDAIKDYFALLFPTRFYTEGIPGTIIDAYAAGVPVISAKWESFGDIVKDGTTGLGYEMQDFQGLVEILENLYLSPEKIVDIKANCTEAAKKYLPQNAMRALVDRL